MRMRLALALAATTLGLTACADDLYGPYGYGGIGVGYGYGSYGSYGYPYGAYGYPYGYGNGGYYGSYDPFGWYGDYYYPGVGFYVYDSYRHPYHWNSDQQRYWMSHRSSWQGHTGRTWNHENWGGFHRSGSTMTSGGYHHHR